MKWLGAIVFCLGLAGAQMKEQSSRLLPHLFTQLGAALIMLFALNVNAQTMVGLPEHGVTLSGSPAIPVLENHSAKAIIAQMLRVYYANESVPINFGNLRDRELWRGMPASVPSGTTDKPFQVFVDHPPAIRLHGTTPENPTAVVLDSVLFADGEMVGPDVVKYFDIVSTRIARIRALATLALQAQSNPQAQASFWAELDRIATARTDADQYKVPLAMDIRAAHLRGQDTEAFERAKRSLSLPTPWRKQ